MPGKNHKKYRPYKKRNSTIMQLKNLQSDYDVFDDYELGNETIMVQCRECHAQWTTKPFKRSSAIEQCPCCGKTVVVVGMNTIQKSRPDLLKYLIDPRDAYIYNTKSNKKLKSNVLIVMLKKRLLLII